jgi:capsular polysaccharide transport system ATP-binding protein
MIHLHNVSSVLTSGRLRTNVLDDVSIALPTDRRLVILGQDGSGKTTLIRLLSGAVMPTSGAVVRHARVSFPVGFSGGYKRTLSAHENIAHVARLYGADVDEVVEFVSQVTGFGHALGELFEDLPSHIRGRLAYAVSYAIPFDVYLIDNSVAWGDQDFRQKCEQMYEARAQTSGIIYATRAPRFARRYGGTVGAILHNGKLVLYDDLDRAIWDFERLENTAATARRAAQELNPTLDEAS